MEMVGRVEGVKHQRRRELAVPFDVGPSAATLSISTHVGARAHAKGFPSMAYRVLSEAELLNEKSMGPGVKGVRLVLCLGVLEKDGWVLLATTAEGLYVFRRPE